MPTYLYRNNGSILTICPRKFFFLLRRKLVWTPYIRIWLSILWQASHLPAVNTSWSESQAYIYIYSIYRGTRGVNKLYLLQPNTTSTGVPFEFQGAQSLAAFPPPSEKSGMVLLLRPALVSRKELRSALYFRFILVCFPDHSSDGEVNYL